jgi:uncharacterized membrane protein
VLLWGLGLSLLLAGVLSSVASTHPDGLEYVAHQLGFSGTSTSPTSAAGPLAGYSVPGVSGPLSGGVAGVIGVVVVAALAFGLMRLLRRSSSERR